MARTANVSVGTVHALWQANDLKPHRTRTFKLSNDPQFETKFWDVIGLYLNPPDKALVLCCDEKSQCCSGAGANPTGAALGRGPHQNTHGMTISGMGRSHFSLRRCLTWMAKFSAGRRRTAHPQGLAGVFSKLDRGANACRVARFISSSTITRPTSIRPSRNGSPGIRAFTCTSRRRAVRGSIWFERFFRDLTEERRPGVGSFGSVRELVQAMETYLTERNLAPKRYVWKKKGEEILAKISRARVAQAATPQL